MINSELFTQKRCNACGIDCPDIEEHHIIPSCIKKDNTYGTILLCSKHHDIIHHMLLGFIYKNRLVEEEELFQKIIEWTDWYCKLEWDKFNHLTTREFLANHCIWCRNPARFKWWDYDREIGLFGLCDDCNKWVLDKEREYLLHKKTGDLNDTPKTPN